MIIINKIEYSNCFKYSFTKNGIEFYSKQVEIDDELDFDGWVRQLYGVLGLKV